jgi:DNA-binding NtrC family response regulator/tetratricopeptide (TPR) repeat protein
MGSPLERLIGESPGIAELREQITRLLARPLESGRRPPPILLLGETGTGKGLVANAIHQAGPRADGPFVDLNCAAIPDTLLEAELFGEERGASSDNRPAKPGLLHVAHGGTLFLDEVGLLPDALQAKILKALDERAVRRRGPTPREVADMWVIAATSQDLLAAVRARRFREDLYHRLAVVTLRLPALRERGDDVLLLAEHFLAEACADYGLPPRPLTVDAREALINHSWPGNVRELANAMERVALLTDVAVTAESLGLRHPVSGGLVDGLAERRAIARAETHVERENLLDALRTERWNLTRTAERLGLPRNTLRYRMEKHGLLAPRGRALARAAASTTGAATSSLSAPEDATTTAQSDVRRVAFLQARLDLSMATPESRRLMESLIHKLRGFGGVVDVLTPGSVLAVFGVEPLEDSPRRAALAALAVRQLVARVQADGKGSAVMLAVHTARERLTPDGKHTDSEPDAAMPARAIVARLCAEAAPGEILVSAPAESLLTRRFEVAAVDEARHGAAGAYRLIGPAPVERELVPFLGRRPELELLLDRFERAAAGRGQAVQLIGDPGIGKSRLLRELRRRLAGRAIWSESQADPVRRGRALFPVIELIRRAAGIDDSDPEAVAVAALERHVLRVSAELRVDLPWLRDMLGLGSCERVTSVLEPESRRERLFEANRRLLLYAARRRPQVVVVEDVHWADPASLEFLARLAESASGHRALLLVTSRPGAEFHLADRTHHTRLSLEGLTIEESLAMARALLDAHVLAPEIEALVVERGEGNPFFVEELVRSLLDSGALERGGDGAVFAAPAALRTVPATVQDMIHARIARLDAASRALLELAAVVGTEVPLAVLRATAVLPQTTTLDGLERLQAAELLTERALPEPALAFKHALTREVAYSGLPPERRRILHARVAGAIERAYGERAGEQVERLAHHAVLGHLWDRAVGWLRQAGVRATERSDNGQAVAFFEQALLALERLPEGRDRTAQAIDVRFELCSALFPLGEVRRALQHLREAEQLADAVGDVQRLGWAATSMANCLAMIGDLAEAHRAGERAARLADDLADPRLTIVSRIDLGIVHQERGEAERAVVLFREALGRLEPEQWLERFGMPTPAAIYLRSLLGANLAERGDFVEAIAAGEEAVRMAETAGLAFGLGAARVRLGEIYLVLGDAGRAAAIIEPALALLADRQLPLWLPRAAAALGWSRVLAGRTDEGAALLDQARERGGALPYFFRYSRCLVWRGHAALEAGDLDRAGELAGEALAQSRSRGEHGYELEARHLAAKVMGLAGGPVADSAARDLAETAERAAVLGLRPLVAHCRLSAGELCSRQRDHERAREHLAAAAALYHTLGMPIYGARAERRMADA